MAFHNQSWRNASSGCNFWICAQPTHRIWALPRVKMVIASIPLTNQSLCLRRLEILILFEEIVTSCICLLYPVLYWQILSLSDMQKKSLSSLALATVYRLPGPYTDFVKVFADFLSDLLVNVDKALIDRSQRAWLTGDLTNQNAEIKCRRCYPLSRFMGPCAHSMCVFCVGLPRLATPHPNQGLHLQPISLPISGSLFHDPLSVRLFSLTCLFLSLASSVFFDSCSAPARICSSSAGLLFHGPLFYELGRHPWN